MPEKDAKGHIGARAAALISRLRALELPDAAKGLKGEWLAVSCAVCIFVITAVVCAARGARNSWGCRGRSRSRWNRRRRRGGGLCG